MGLARFDYSNLFVLPHFKGFWMFCSFCPQFQFLRIVGKRIEDCAHVWVRRICWWSSPCFFSESCYCADFWWHGNLLVNLPWTCQARIHTSCFLSYAVWLWAMCVRPCRQYDLVLSRGHQGKRFDSINKATTKLAVVRADGKKVLHRPSFSYEVYRMFWEFWRSVPGSGLLSSGICG